MRTFIAVLALLLGLPLAAAEPDFQRDIRPILSNACFHCHGADAESREADLRLDQQHGLKEVAGRSNESELLRRILSDDPDEVMPPPESGKLSPDQIALLKRWVATGADWQEHWSFVAPVRPGLPAETRDHAWVRQPFDAFVLRDCVRKGSNRHRPLPARL